MDNLTDIEKAIAGGVVGGALGAVFTNKSSHTVISALMGAALVASLGAYKKAKETKIPILYEENGAIYRLHPSGKKELVKKTKQLKVKLSSSYTIE